MQLVEQINLSPISNIQKLYANFFCETNKN